MLIDLAYAQGAAGSGSSTALVQFVPLILIFGVMYFILFRPQQQQQKALRSAIGGLRRGDKVVTGGGIVAVVQRVPPDVDGKPAREIEVEIATGVKVTVLRETIGQVLKTEKAVAK